MLDKSVPFHTIIMKRENKRPVEKIHIPDGFTVRTYEPGDEIGWAEIEAGVLEFDSVKDALECHKGYLPSIEELKKRQWFVVSPTGVIAATATAWWEQNEKGRVPVVHALGCRPEFQGLGLGRIAATKMLEAFYELDNGNDIYLDTQTWSYKAVGLYLELGFKPLKKEVFNSTKNEYEQALPILKEHMKENLYKRFVESAE